VSHRILDLNEALASWLGGSRAQLTGASFDELLLGRCPEIGPLLVRAWAEAASLTEHQFSAESGSEQPWFRLETARNSAGLFVRLSSILPPLRELMEQGGAQIEDSEKQQLRVRVLRAESQLDKLIQRWPGVLFSQRADFSFQYANGKIGELTGLSPEAWRNQSLKFWEVVHEAHGQGLLHPGIPTGGGQQVRDGAGLRRSVVGHHAADHRGETAVHRGLERNLGIADHGAGPRFQ
jgi:PAS domain-containing protein